MPGFQLYVSKGQRRVSRSLQAGEKSGNPRKRLPLLISLLYSMLKPPVTGVAVPVRKPLSSLAKNATTRATSCGCAMRPSGVSAAICCFCAAGIWALSSVSTIPGATTLAVMPAGPYSLAT